MKRQYESCDVCSYISMLPESNTDSQFGCICTGVAAILLLVIVFLVSGCSTCYVAALRYEYNERGYVDGVYYGRDEYPTVFPATRIAAAVEIPHWWSSGRVGIARNYQLMFWPFGAALSLADVPISMVTDTCMLPYDLAMSLYKDKGEVGYAY